MTSPRPGSPVPPTLLVWTLNDSVIEQPGLLERQFHEIRGSGFGGVAAFVRCSRYTWNDTPARRAFRAIGRLCRSHGMDCWIGPDPRFVSRELIAPGRGLEVLLFGNRSRADIVPNLGHIVNGAFSVRCDLSPRHVHTLNEVAIEYAPTGLARVYAVRNGGEAGPPAEVVDITSRTRFFYNARDRYIEAFGVFPGAAEAGWSVLAFFTALTNHVDYSERRQIRAYLALLARLRDEGCAADGIMWDEAGFTCTYGTLPFSTRLREEYARETGHALSKDLWKLALAAKDESHIRVRNTFYRTVQRLLNEANTLTTRRVQRLWGTGVVSGIHDTWHFESADMCDMNHGSLDLWEAMKTKTGGFVDLGGIDQLRDPDSPWYANLATMSAICASLGRMSSGQYAYNNLWTVGDDDGEGWQAGIMSHCVDVMALFGTNWLAHAYGPVGTIGQERGFLGSPPLPGYPDHSTWIHFPGWNVRLAEHLEAIEHRLPAANLLVVYPIETLYALAGPAANAVAAGVFRLVLALLDNHYHVEIFAASMLGSGTQAGNAALAGGRRYDAVLLPSPQVLDRRTLAFLQKSGKHSVFLSGHPQRRTNGSGISTLPIPVVQDIGEALQWLDRMPHLRPVLAPPRSWVTATEVTGGMMVSVVPSRYGCHDAGQVSLNGMSVHIPQSDGLTRIFFPGGGTPEIQHTP